MENKQKITTGAVYRQIAIDIAKKVVSGEYVEGQKLYGRSVLASHYKVSPETIRKATHLLKDVGILNTKKGSGIEVESVKQAKIFIDRYIEVENITDLKNEVSEWASRQMKETSEIIKKIQFIVDTSERLKSVSPFNPYEIKITKESTAIGKTATELQFWNITGGTIIAIARNDVLILSPGPEATFLEGDVFYIIGNDEAFITSRKLLFE